MTTLLFTYYHSCQLCPAGSDTHCTDNNKASGPSRREKGNDHTTGELAPKDCKIIGAFHTHCTGSWFVFTSCIYNHSRREKGNDNNRADNNKVPGPSRRAKGNDHTMIHVLS